MNWYFVTITRKSTGSHIQCIEMRCDLDSLLYWLREDFPGWTIEAIRVGYKRAKILLEDLNSQ